MQPGTRLGRYTIVGLIGRGGMGAVYRATDPSLGRDIALKVLPPDVAADPDRLERFRREARTLAALNHPNIVTIHSVEQDGDTHFLTMELVSGRPLDAVIEGRPMPLERVQTIARAVTDALSAAHEKGIIHRDLKPANIVQNDSGFTKVLDFGLAKMRETPGVPGASMTRLETQVGTIVGTPAYMSPEQIAGQDIDQRSDIFSLGVVLYEMVTGVRPFTGRSTLEMASSVLHDAPAPASVLRSTLPEELATVIGRCLEKSAGSRFASMADVRKALDGAGRASTPAPAAGPSIAVLPFKNLSADPDSEFFSDGLAEEIINALSQIDGLRVAARTSSFSFKNQSVEIGEIAAKLHVAHVLDGSVRRAGNRVRVTLQLVDARSGFQSWSERYDRDIADIFDVQDEIARAIADKLKVTLAGGAQRLVKQATANVEAYELFLRGRALIQKRGKHVAPGTECLKRAVELDPAFAAAWAGLADAFTVRGYWGLVPPGESMPQALTAARRAVATDPELADGHCALAAALMLWEHDYEGARRSFRRGLELNPNYTQGRCWYALFMLLYVSDEPAAAAAEARRAQEGDPLSAYTATILALTLAGTGELEEALTFARLGAQRDPDALVGLWTHGLVAHWHGSFEESVAAFTRALEVSDRASYPMVHMAVAYAEWGKTAEAQALHDELIARRARSYVTYLSHAVTSAALGQMDAAIEYANQACDHREPAITLFARNFPNLRRLRADPRFGEVLRRLALPGYVAVEPEAGAGAATS
jgi:serine/threonine protein kinase/tetratricopeptide (TPR) repeat protein